MKKILLFLAFLPLIALAQIGPIQTEERPLEFISGSYLYRTKATDEYTLQIVSSNQFETTAVHLSLGYGTTESMSSLRSLYEVMTTSEQQFKLQGYTFQVQRNTIAALHVGPLEYAAGNYILYKRNLTAIMYDLLTNKEMAIDSVQIVYYDQNAVFVRYLEYGFEKPVNLNNVAIPYSKTYSQGDVISGADLQLLKEVANNPNAYRPKTSKSGAFVHDKNELIRACDILLSK